MTTLYNSLFDKKVHFGSTDYFIHGLIHDGPSIYLSKEIKEAINRQLQGLPVVCEDGFSYWIPHAIPFGEKEYFGLDKPKLSGIITYFKKSINNKLSSILRKESLVRIVTEVRTLEDMRIMKEIFLRNYMPEPEGMNLQLLRLNNGTIDNPKGDLPLNIQRYVYEAKESIKYAESNNLERLHIVVGCAHELPLEYFLKHPEILSRLRV